MRELYHMKNSDEYSLAKEGNPKAIEALINKTLSSKGISVKASLNYDCLSLVVKSKTSLNQKAVGSFLQQGLTKLNPQNIERVVIKGGVANQESNQWQLSFSLSESSKEHNPETKTPIKAVQKIKRIDKYPEKKQKIQVKKQKKILDLTTKEITQLTIEFVQKEQKKIAILFFTLLSLFILFSLFPSKKINDEIAQEQNTDSIEIEPSQSSNTSVELWNDTTYGMSESELFSQFDSSKMVRVPDSARMCINFYENNCYEYRMEGFLVNTSPVISEIYFDVYFIISEKGLEEVILVKEPIRFRDKNNFESTDRAKPEETVQHIMDEMAISLMLSGIYGEPQEKEVDRLVEKLTIWEFPEQNKSVTFSNQEKLARIEIRYETYEGRQRRLSKNQRPDINGYQL